MRERKRNVKDRSLLSNLLNRDPATAAIKKACKNAAKGDVEAMLYAADALMKGIGTPKDERSVVRYLQKAAGKGNVTAMVKLAKCYDGGLGVEKDPRKVAEWAKKAADLGDADGKARRLGREPRRRRCPRFAH